MTTPIIEYRRPLEKGEWGPGEWQDEPDKVQWVDEASGLDCLIVRTPLGYLCGYVGVTEGHPYFGVAYSQCPEKCEEVWCAHSPESRMEVHGGLTFSDFCTEASRETWQRWRASLLACADEAKKYPKGDSARAFAEAGRYIDDYDGWLVYAESRFICHVPFPGRPARVWWLGFDCAHFGDSSPGLSRHDDYGSYKPVSYVKAECARLARQLARVSR